MDRQDPAHTIILIDQSDPFSENDLAWVDELIDNEARTLPRFGRLTVVLPNSATPFDPTTLYSHCSPGSVEDANPILQNPRMIDDTWREQFYLPLTSTVGETLKTTSQPSSPLFEALYSVGDRADFQSNRKNRRLVIVSDLMQHSDGFSFYRYGADLAAYSEASWRSRCRKWAALMWSPALFRGRNMICRSESCAPSGEPISIRPARALGRPIRAA